MKLPTNNSDFNFITIVSGLPRSGTSMMMKMLEAGGLDVLVDNIRKPNQDNPYGYYEFEEVKALKDGNIGWLPKASGKVVKVIASLIPHLPMEFHYQIIIMRRSLPEILASQLKMLSNRGQNPKLFNPEIMVDVYQKHLQQIDGWLKQQTNVRFIDISYNDLLSNPKPHLENINEFFGGGLDIVRMENVIDPHLYRQRKAD
jgi:hypothetical protein